MGTVLPNPHPVPFHLEAQHPSLYSSHTKATGTPATVLTLPPRSDDDKETRIASTEDLGVSPSERASDATHVRVLFSAQKKGVRSSCVDFANE